jgi:hypothetical protein
MTPQSGSAFDAALTPGHSFYDAAAPGGGVVVTVNSISSAGANITINFGTNETGVQGSANRQELQPYLTTLIIITSAFLNL